MMQYWLLKTEPHVFDWEELVEQGQAHWDGVRNYAARNHLQSMKVDDLGLMYYSGKDRTVVGVVRIVESAYQDPTTDDGRWVAVKIVAEGLLKRPVSLDEIKADPKLSDMVLVRNSRLSVQPVTQLEFEHIMAMAGGIVHG
jgi:predicted RNA-binding protein with PUA-like domain